MFALRLAPPAMFTLLLAATTLAQIPHGQSKPPGPALTPEQAVKKMTVPEGFSVEVVAAEPDLVNPVAMTFDERGRIWVTESLEYPRFSPGPGKDRVKILEDTDGDGRVDKTTIFADDLNIPSGIAVGHGGVWVANSPDLLFMRDTDGDGRADRREVVVTGFGRTDTHELPNSLTWGPDGWLYGLNGVFNRSHVKQGDREWKFTCAMFRVHPRTREFQLFAEGTSNPWGIAWDPEGSAFLSACVIDHLWHLTETGYYHRQSGAYPPFTWKIGSIVNHKHQKAAYCGIQYLDTDAYPEAWRDCLVMGNIHGNCLNVDVLERRGSTYFAKPRPDFLSANDAWFMPVAQKVGPDGCLYVLDWYDRYHCYQDARRDPEGIDRLKGRLYRIRYRDTPRAEPFNLATESDEQLVARLHSGNVYYRELAQRLLSERVAGGEARRLAATLEQLIFSDAAKKTRLHALWALIGGGPLDLDFHARLLAAEEASLRAWGVRAAGNQAELAPELMQSVVALAREESPDVRLQVAITAAKRQPGSAAIPTLLGVLERSGEDPLIPHIVWQNVHPRLDQHSDAYLKLAEQSPYAESPAVTGLMPRVVERILAAERPSPVAIARLLSRLVSGKQVQIEPARQCLALLAEKSASGEIKEEQQAELRRAMRDPLAIIFQRESAEPLRFQAAILAAAWQDEAAMQFAEDAVIELGRDISDEQRAQAFEALVAAGAAGMPKRAAPILVSDKTSRALKAAVLDALARLETEDVAEVVLSVYGKLDADVQPRAIELLTQRPAWAKALVADIGRQEIPASAVNVNQVRRLLATGDAELATAVKRLWGAVRTERNPQRELVIAQMRTLLRKTPGNAHRGQQVYKKVCGQCHKIYGEGAEVGPDITRNGRGSYEQLLSNVFDPSLVIGEAYQARTVITAGGRVVTGLIEEDSPRRIVLKLQGGKREVIPRDDVDEVAVSRLSLMPEDLEKQLKPRELSDLFAFLALDRPPADPEARQIPGARAPNPAVVALPKSVANLLIQAKLSSNAFDFGKNRRGGVDQMLFDPTRGEFWRKSQWHEIGPAFGEDIGVVPEEQPLFWMAEWKQPIDANLITLSGTYENQPQKRTGWKIEVRVDGTWLTLDRGVGDWYDRGRYLWGGAGVRPLRIDGFRVSVFSPDDTTRLKSIHFRGEPGFSWVVANVPTGVDLE